MPTLEMIWQIQTVKQVHQCLLGRAPSYLVGKFVTNASVRDCHMTTCGVGQLHLHQPHTWFYRSSFEYELAKVFNALPENIRSTSYGTSDASYSNASASDADYSNAGASEAVKAHNRWLSHIQKIMYL